MKILKPLAFVFTLAGILFAVSCSTTDSAQGLAAATSVRHDVLYVCDCGPDCQCTSVSTKPGKCSCGKDLKAARSLKVEQDAAWLCPCGLDCKCALDPNDATKCGCGKPVRKVSLKGSGIYFCNCGGSCACNTFMDQPGQCKCGMALKRAE